MEAPTSGVRSRSFADTGQSAGNAYSEIMTTKHRSRSHTGDHDEWCDDPRPHPLSSEEWAELIAVPEVRESWGLEEDTTPEEFASRVYAVKFHFHSGSPGYVGDLFIVQGDVLTGDAPFMIVREKGKLVLL